MRVNSISGLTCYVKDLARTAEFYETIGFRRGKVEDGRATFYVNWFFVTFIAQDQEDDAEEFHKGALSAGMKPVNEAQVQPSGNREFVLRDPDGYKLAFFQKK